MISLYVSLLKTTVEAVWIVMVLCTRFRASRNLAFVQENYANDPMQFNAIS